MRARLQTALAALVHRLRGHSTASLLKTPAPHVSFTAPEAGVLAVTLTRRSRSSRSAAAAVILAAGHKSYARPRKAVASLRPTAAGRRALRHTRRVAASLKLVFTPKVGGTPITTKRALTLGR